MENFKFERKTNLPLMHIKVPIGTRSLTRYVSKAAIDNVVELLKKIKSRYQGKYEVVVTPHDFEIEMERGTVVVLNINISEDIENVIKKLDELGGTNNDTPENRDSVDGCKEGESVD